MVKVGDKESMAEEERCGGRGRGRAMVAIWVEGITADRTVGKAVVAAAYCAESITKLTTCSQP